jgi:hypothetical protein
MARMRMREGAERIHLGTARFTLSREIIDESAAE